MDSEQYSIIADSSHLSYKFKSIGPKGVIKKKVLYRKLNPIYKNYYNLSFGDWDEKSGSIDGIAISNNNDTKKVLFTVALTILEFVRHFPNSTVLIVGSTNSRTRLYQIAISQNYKEIEKLFEIYGFRNAEWGKFKSGINFEAFLIKTKVNNL
jgi:hypothetical protein